MKKTISKNESLISIPEIQEYKNKYRLAAEEIYECLGTGNFSNIYNCMTRFRATIENKDLVKLDEIKKIPLVKGTHWNGHELQIIIGGEVVKVVDEFKQHQEELLKPPKKVDEIKVKKSIGSRILNAIVGIMGPALGLLMASGILSALYAVLTIPGSEVLTTSIQQGVKEDGTPIMVAIGMGNLSLFNIWSGIFYVLSKVILNSIGVFFIYNTARYFKGNTWFALAVGITLMCRGFFPSTSVVDFANAGFGDWVSNQGKSGWLLLKLGTYPIVVGGYEGAVIPYIVGGIIVVYADKWIKTWMPTTVDIIFRSTLVYVISIFSLWFLLAPISSLIEFGLIQAMTWFGKIPYGIGTGLVAFLWQPLVLTGSHVPIALATTVEIINEHPSMLRAAIDIGPWGQVGAAIGVAIVTKNSNLRKVSLGAIPAGIFGITEPIIYGVTLPKVRPFLLGCVGALAGGVLSGAFGIARHVPAGLGVFAVFGFTDGPKEVGLGILTWVVAVGVGALLAALLYKERKDELGYFKKGTQKLANLTYSKDNKDLKLAMKKEFEVIEQEIKTSKEDYKKMSKYYSEISQCEQKMLSLENKESKYREKLYKELMSVKNKLIKKQTEELLNKFNKVNLEYSSYSLEKQKDEVQIKLNQIIHSNKELLEKFNQTKEVLYQNACAKSLAYTNEKNKDNVLAVNNMFYNALNSVEIGFGIEDARLVGFRKEK